MSDPPAESGTLAIGLLDAYARLLVELYELEQHSPRGSPGSEQLRGQMDALWVQMTPEQQEKAARWKTTIEIDPVLDKEREHE